MTGHTFILFKLIVKNRWKNDYILFYGSFHSYSILPYNLLENRYKNQTLMKIDVHSDDLIAMNFVDLIMNNLPQ